MKKPLTIADLFDLHTVSDPQISPDGQWVAYVVTEADLKNNVYNSDVYLVPAEGVSRTNSQMVLSETIPRAGPRTANGSPSSQDVGKGSNST